MVSEVVTEAHITGQIIGSYLIKTSKKGTTAVTDGSTIRAPNYCRDRWINNQSPKLLP
ncbi:hypothetical protein DPMN_172053 [Dreissena polymorpha]|uniref:Uncharacterized protein n=1 Tax=Dreissena polymorpha TaxID=45954 RepID=A0A9D4E2E1_DREPO|nr:hypothetical protein DPMN_172053 [Dreissena polymorpha]